MKNESPDIKKLTEYLNYYLDPEDPEVLNDIDVCLPNELVGVFGSFSDEKNKKWIAETTNILRDDIEIELVSVLDREELRPMELALVNTRIKLFLETQGFSSTS